MTPSERTMPVITVEGPRPDRSYVVHLPARVDLVMSSRNAAEEAVRKHASGSALKWVPWVPSNG